MICKTCPKMLHSARVSHAHSSCSWLCCQPVRFRVKALHSCLQADACLQVGFVVVHGWHKRIIMNGPAIAKYYVQHGTAFIDIFSVVPFFAQVSAPAYNKLLKCQHAC